jgi:hypothetical protein
MKELERMALDRWYYAPHRTLTGVLGLRSLPGRTAMGEFLHIKTDR